MKRFIGLLAFFAALVCWPCLSFGAGASTVLTSHTKYWVPAENNGAQQGRMVLKITATADDGTGAFNTIALDPGGLGILGWYILEVDIKPGSTGPTNGAWDLDVTDANAWLVSQNLMDNLASSGTQHFKGGAFGYPMIKNTWTLSIGDNVVNSAVAVIYLTFASN